MPFTPFHWGLTLLIPEIPSSMDRLRRRILQAWGLILVTIPDIEGFAHVVLNLHNIEIHGPLHSFVSCILIGIVGSAIYYLLFQSLFLHSRKISTGVSTWDLAYLALIPLCLHLFLDLPMYKDIEPWWPFSSTKSQFYFESGFFYSYVVALVAWIGFLVLLAFRFFNNKFFKSL